MTFDYKNAKVVRVIDGDTVELEIDMGNHITWRGSFRLYGIDAPDKNKERKQEATDYLTKLLSGGLSRVETYKPDKYGRWLVDLYIKTDGGEILVNTVMTLEGFAVPYFGGRKAWEDTGIRPG